MYKYYIFIFIFICLSMTVESSPIKDLTEIGKRYGELDRQIKYEWEDKTKWLVEYEFPSLGKGWVNKDILPRIEAVMARINMLGLDLEIDRFAGCYNPRGVRGQEDTPSLHAYGLACDFFPVKDKFSNEFVRVWTDEGFCHGRSFNDEIHFSYGHEC